MMFPFPSLLFPPFAYTMCGYVLCPSFQPKCTTVELSEEYCQKHFLLGLLLNEVNLAILFEPTAQRRKAFRVLMRVVAKLDLDDRYQDKVESGVFF